MNVLLTGGGTGGHIYPAIAIADKIRRKNPEANILFVGTEKGMEKDLVPKNGYDIKFITVSGINRKNPLKNIKTLCNFIKGSRQAGKLIDEFKPDIAIGTGGYVSGPVIRIASKKGIRVYIHEQNVVPGITNRLLESYVEKVFISFPESSKYFKNEEKLALTGNPIRKSFLVSGIHDYRRKLGIDPKEFVILCFGGSRGAEKINSVMEEVSEFMDTIPNLRLYFITGTIHYESIAERLNRKELTRSGRIVLIPYTEKMHEYLLASDLVISRAGALTVSEITACGRPSILIPSPNVTGNHQYFNAKAVEDKGGCVLIEEKSLSKEKLISTIMRLFNNRELLNAMADASKEIGKTDGADAIYDHLNLSEAHF